MGFSPLSKLGQQFWRPAGQDSFSNVVTLIDNLFDNLIDNLFDNLIDNLIDNSFSSGLVQK